MDVGAVVWFTGLPCSGKTTLAQAVARHLVNVGRRTQVLDGDELRASISRDLGFSKEDRDAHVARATSLASSVAVNGDIAIVALVSPYAEARHRARLHVQGLGAEFIEIFVDAEPTVLASRDRKHLYQRAIAGEIPHFTGISDPYEIPHSPDLTLRTDQQSIEDGIATIWSVLQKRRIVGGGTSVRGVAG